MVAVVEGKLWSPCQQFEVRLGSNTTICKHSQRLICCEWLDHVGLQHKGLLGNSLFTLLSLFLSFCIHGFVSLQALSLYPRNLDVVDIKDHTHVFQSFSTSIFSFFFSTG